jgi:hypothetical protein
MTDPSMAPTGSCAKPTLEMAKHKTAGMVRAFIVILFFPGPVKKNYYLAAAVAKVLAA